MELLIPCLFLKVFPAVSGAGSELKVRHNIIFGWCENFLMAISSAKS
jgi:hypothetical protein